MDRRTILRYTGLSLTGLLAGCSSNSSTAESHTAIKSGKGKFPSYSGTVTITGKEKFWSFGFDISDKFKLSYKVENMKPPAYGFDVFLFTQTSYNEYVEKVQGDGGSPIQYSMRSQTGISKSVSRNLIMKPGKYYFVIDNINSSIGDAGASKPGQARKVKIDLQTKPYNQSTETEITTPTETTTPDTRHSSGETFTVGNGAKKLQYTVQPDGIYNKVGITEADGIFFVAKLGIKNVGSEPVTIISDMYTLVNEEGDKYEPSTSAMLQMENSLVFKELNPGVRTTGHIPFDIPQGQEGVDDIPKHTYALLIEPAGVFSTAKTHIVDLANVDL